MNIPDAIKLVHALLLATAGAAVAADVTLDNPAGGWRYNDKNIAGFSQEVHYPASSVNAEGHKDFALIKGSIERNPKTREQKAVEPNRLVVNGVAMPLLMNEGGNFARPFAFGPGSNSVEVRTPEGAKKRVQFYEGRAERLQTKLRVVLSWDSDGSDLDLHVVSPDGQHVFYGARRAANGGALDVDVTTGYGPEIFASPAPPKGIYHVYVNYYGSGERKDVITVAQVAIISNENTPNEKQQVYRVPMRKPGEVTLVKSFIF